jgi:hypothetical protein
MRSETYQPRCRPDDRDTSIPLPHPATASAASANSAPLRPPLIAHGAAFRPPDGSEPSLVARLPGSASHPSKTHPTPLRPSRPNRPVIPESCSPRRTCPCSAEDPESGRGR